MQDVELDKAQLKVLHATIKKVTDDIESLSFNTAIAQMMVFVNAFTTAQPKSVCRDADVARPAESVRAASHLGALGDVE